MRRLLVTANIPSSPILVTLMIVGLSSSVTSVLMRATRRNIPEDTILVGFIANISTTKLAYDVISHSILNRLQYPIIPHFITMSNY
jgi:hypothetical protein